ncbi:MAG: hypothetical protein WDZ91_04380 [Paenibacillaceae bacterium]
MEFIDTVFRGLSSIEMSVTGQVYESTVNDDVYGLYTTSDSQGDMTQYSYDGDGNRIKMTVGIDHGSNANNGWEPKPRYGGA